MDLIQIALRSLQFLWTLLITALVGNVIADAFSGNSSSINFAIFVAVLSWVVLLYGFAAAFVEALAMPIVLLAMDGVAVLFTFIAGVVLAAKLGVHSCGSTGYVIHNPLTNGSADPTKRCHELQASCAFFWFLFAAYVGSLVMAAVGSKGGMTSGRGGIRRGGPSMSQV